MLIKLSSVENRSHLKVMARKWQKIGVGVGVILSEADGSDSVKEVKTEEVCVDILGRRER